ARDEGGGSGKGGSLCSEEDVTRFFQILLQTDDDLRRKPDPRVHLEMGLLRLINAGRLAPLEELLAELRGGSSSGTPSRSAASAAPAASPARREMASAAAVGSYAPVPTPKETAPPARESFSAAPFEAAAPKSPAPSLAPAQEAIVPPLPPMREAAPEPAKNIETTAAKISAQ